MNTLGMLFFVFMLLAAASGLVGLRLLGRRGTATRSGCGHVLLLPIYLLLVVGVGGTLWEWYTAITYFTPKRADLVGEYVVDAENSTAYVQSTMTLILRADATYSLSSSLLPASQGTWAMPGPAQGPFKPAIKLSQSIRPFQLVVVRQARGFQLAIQGLDPDDTSMLMLYKERKYRPTNSQP